MKREKICVIAACLLSFVLTAGITARRMQSVHAEVEGMQRSLAKEVFRFHVIAESDSKEDQKVKLKVRDAILHYMRSDMRRTEKQDVEATEIWTIENRKELEKTANRVLEKEGMPYRAKAEVTTTYFPDKRYGDVLFPQGRYKALKITLGNGRGHNWWCVLYPNLCFNNATCAVVDSDGKKELKKTLSAEEYEMVTATSKFKIKWFFFGAPDGENDKEHTKESDKI